MPRNRRRRLALGSLRKDEGAVAILVSLFCVVMFVLAALIVDMGMAKVMRRNAQAAADAAALAAVNVLYANGATPDFTAAVAAIKQFASANVGTTTADWTACAAATPLAYTPVGQSTCISFDSATSPTNVRVIIPPKRAPSFFGAVVGYRGVDVGAYAQAAVGSGSGGPAGCSFCILGEMNHTAQNASIHVTNGNAWVNGTLDFGPQGGIQTVGGTNYFEAASISNASNTSTPIVYNAGPATDPLSFLSVPPSDMGTLSPAVKTDPCTQGPGYYGGVSRGGSTSCTLVPGLYVFTEPLTLSGNATVTGTGVTLFFTCGAGGLLGSCSSDLQQGSLQAGGGGTIAISAPTTGPRTGLAVLYDRSDTSSFSVKGSSSGTQITGTIYAPSARLDVSGSGCGASFQTQIVVSDFTGNGNPACFNASYDVAQNVPVPPGSSGLVL